MFLNLANCDESVVCNLPNKMRIKGYIRFPYFKEYEIRLPDDMLVAGLLQLTHHVGKVRLPEGLRVKWNLDLSYCSGLETIPKNIKVGSIVLIGCKNLRSISDDLKVKFDIHYDKSTMFIKEILPLRLHSKLEFYESNNSSEKK